MRPPWSCPWRSLLAAGRTAEAQFDLMERAQCLSANGRADRPGVIALIERIAREFQPPPGEPSQGPPGWEPTYVEDKIYTALDKAGYLDESGWKTLEDHLRVGSDYLKVNRLIAEVQAVHGAPRRDPAPHPPPVLENVACHRCRRLLPPVAVFCGYCGEPLGISWTPG
jgi:hypothetical protein